MAIQQHPLPQDITSYRFRLIGDMTIKQFAYLAGFGVAGILVYNTPLPFFFRYPLSFILVMLGVGIAFVPIQGRSMEMWLIAFVKSIYSPTQYIWRQETPPTVSTPSTISPAAITTPPISAPISKIISTPLTTPAVSAPLTTPTVVSSPKIAPPPPITPPTAVITHTSATSPLAPSPTPIVTPLVTPPPSTVAAPVTNLPIPFTPTSPNTLVGLTLTPDGKILDNVMVEIQSKGVTIRATKSNRLGQFMFARPLENGQYQILADKEGVSFSTYSLDLKGEIVKPLKIQAQS